MEKYVLPDLDYDYGALEPHVSAKIMELHHDKHHLAYVNGANQALEGLKEAQETKNFARVAALEHALAFNLSGHILHSLFWKNLSPQGGGRPDGALAKAIDRDFGSFEALKGQFTNAAMTTMGSGWAALVWDPAGKRLMTTEIHDHQSETTTGGIPIMVLDAWEHAYYLQYHNDKARFFEAVWNIWNWKDIAARFERAQAADCGLAAAVSSKKGA
ncbi:MAG: superoxide dismutase [Gammaproteobacteria bacterium]|nr:superoxide dismutase [Gammaproteobacteria bacterium]